LEELGLTLGDNAFEDAFNRFKALADKKKDVYDDDIIALVDPRAHADSKHVRLVSLQVRCGTEGAQEVDMTLNIDGADVSITQQGNGPVDAIFKAIKALIPMAANVRLKLYQVHGVTQGTDAQAEVTVRLDAEGTVVNGQGSDVDTLVASALAYINALCKVDTIRNKDIKTIVQD
jgi:2-isopropylmalate synthase